jgi:5,10-methylenetetrahydromethanopterin reductase
MKIGFMCGMSGRSLCTIDEYIAEVKHAEALGFDQAWMGQVFSTDALMMMALLSRETTTIRLGTAVTPSHLHHPAALAMQVLTASAASAGRFDLGIGVSHKLVVEDMYGLSYAKPVAHMREYLSVLMPLLRGEQCDFDGEQFRVHAKVRVLDAKPVSVVVAALGSKMLEMAGRMADGTTTWMTGPKTLAQHTIPTISRSAQESGRPVPRIVASFPVILTNDVAAAREVLAKKIGVYAYIPSYKAMLDIEGISDPCDIAMVGDETVLRQKLQELKEIGVTDLNAFCIPVDETAAARTMAFLASEKYALA